MQALQQPVVSSNRQPQRLVVWQSVGPLATSDIDREVLVDHDHSHNRIRLPVGLVGLLAAGQFVGSLIRVQGGLELALKVTASDPAQDLPILGRQARVASATPAAAFLEQLVTNTHAHQSASAVSPRAHHLATPLLCDPGPAVR